MRGVSAPVDFLIDKDQEVAGDGRPYEFLHLAQRLAQVQEVCVRDQCPPTKMVEYAVPALGLKLSAHAAALIAGSGWCPRRVRIRWCAVMVVTPALERVWSASGELVLSWSRSR